MQDKLKYIPFSLTILLTAVSLYLTLSFKVGRLHTYKSTFLEFIERSNNSMNDSEIITLFMLVVVIILLAIKNTYWAHAFALLALLSTFRIFQLFLYTYSFKFFFLRIEIISFFILVFHLILNPSILEHLTRKSTSHQQVNPALIDGFTDRFKSKTNEELEELLQSKQHTSNAKTAARFLLEKRQESK